MPTLIKVNQYGKNKANKFRKHFGLTTENFADVENIDFHDYLHTVLGAFPTFPDEDKVLELEDSILRRSNHIPLRGLTYRAI